MHTTIQPSSHSHINRHSHTNSHSNSHHTIHTDVLVIGAGASGLFCAMTAGKNGRKVILIDHANKAGKKILMSGGGRCNFTNYFVEASNYTGKNAHFCKSALTRYSNWEFIALVEKHQIAYHEREHGQLFCDDSAKDILNMLLSECNDVGVNLHLNTQVIEVQPKKNTTDADTSSSGFVVKTQKVQKSKKNTAQQTNPSVNTSANTPTTPDAATQVHIHCDSLVIATGGLSIPTMGATGFGYQVAEQFGHRLIPTQAGLVPFTFTDQLGKMFAELSGISLDVVAFNERISFARPMLFTHRGLSGFAMLQLSNYWQVGEHIHINLVPTIDVADWLIKKKYQYPKQLIRSVLTDFFPKKLLLALQKQLWSTLADTELANIKDEQLTTLGNTLNDWCIKPSGTEGYRTAEVTLGGVVTDEVSSKTFESRKQPNLYFIGEVLDVTGWLGGYNFQWAWASGHACGLAV